MAKVIMLGNVRRPEHAFGNAPSAFRAAMQAGVMATRFIERPALSDPEPEQVPPEPRQIIDLELPELEQSTVNNVEARRQEIADQFSEVAVSELVELVEV